MTMLASIVTRWGLAIANLAGALLFVVLREPIPAEDLRERDTWKQTIVGSGGLAWSETSAIKGRIAGRYLFGWSRWHGDESTWIRIFEAVNLPGLVAIIPVNMVLLLTGASYRMSTNAESWLYAAVFLVVSTAQWLYLGLRLHRRLRRRGTPREPIAA